eukprot:TRINITY_DN3205_c0_g1_i1.p1 TRINITY_DN3205_c0_g1~~TRINITY_DN3205_c0_g1_i1.p1  ORF type:complete len:691 (+),score=258.76 TRINITY_DN3205_c0_g1_i1:108-2180(+)
MDSCEKKVHVAVRIRPRLPVGCGSKVQNEEYQHPDCCIVPDEFTLRLQEQKQDENCKSQTFTFDFVFDTDSQQSEIYEEAVQELVDASLAGCNSTVLAYGQTGSGKTHTVLGQVKANPLDGDLLTPQSGLFLRTLKDLFEFKKRREDKAYVVIALSCIEIYLDEARDLLSSNPKEKMKIQMTDEDVKMPTLTRFEIFSLSDVYKHFNDASKQRETRETDANSTSSRSHCLFMIDIVQQERTDKNPSQPDIVFLKDITLARKKGAPPKRAASPQGTGSSPDGRKGATPTHFDPSLQNIIYPRDQPPIMYSKIVLADLAGSEKATGKTGSNAIANADAFNEMKKINMSLTALGNVVHSLHEGASHVPYRNSTLTRILRPSFSAPSAKVLLISNLSPTQLSYDESHSTLLFANKVKAMKVSNTTVGADQQQLQFDFLETQKTNWALLADHHIAQLHFENRPMLRKHTDLITSPFNIHRMKAKAMEKERLKIIRALESTAGRDEKAACETRVAARKKKEKDQRDALEKEIVEGLIDEFSNKVADLQQKNEALDKIANEFNDTLSKDVAVLQTEITEHEGIAAKLKAEKGELREQIEQHGAQLTALIAERARLNEQEKKKKEENQGRFGEEERALAQCEGEYAQAAFDHCVAQQYFIRFKSYRETHTAMLDMQKQNILRLNHAIAESEKLNKMLK